MSNPYRQFNIRPQQNARPQSIHANSAGLNGLNIRDPTLAAVCMLPSPAAYDSYRLYNAAYSNTPVMAIGGSTLGQVAVVPLDGRLHPPTDFAGAAGLYSNNLQHQFMPRATAVLQNPMPVLPPQTPSVHDAYNVPVFPGVAVMPGYLNNTFRQMHWNPPLVQPTYVPQLPYALEIKPENCETPPSHVPRGDVPTINTAFMLTGANWQTQSAANEQQAPTVYVDVAMDNNRDPDARTANLLSNDSGATAVKAVDKNGKRKGDKNKNQSGEKVLKLADKYSLKPCVVSMERIDISSINCRESYDSVDEVSVSDNSEQTITALDTDSEPEIEELADSQDMSIPVTQSTNTSAAQVEECCSSQAIPLTVCQESVEDSDSGPLIGSDEDVGDDPAYDDGGGDQCSPKETATAAESECYEVVPTNSDALLFDMECDGENDGELRVLLPSKKCKPTTEAIVISDSTNCTPTTATSVLLTSKNCTPTTETSVISASKNCPPTTETGMISTSTNCTPTTATSVLLTSKNCTPTTATSTHLRGSNFTPTTAFRKLLPKLPSTQSQCKSSTEKCISNVAASKKTWWPSKPVQSQRLHKVPTSSASEIISIDVDLDNSDDVVVVECDASESSVAPQRLAASACNEKISAAQNELEAIEIKRNENSVLGVPLHSSFFRFEAQSMQVFRLLAMVKNHVPENALELLTGLTKSVGVTEVNAHSLNSDTSSSALSRIPSGESRTLLFQCLFCPYGELSAKRIMAHIANRHSKYASFIQRSLLPSKQALLYIYCRHCDFISYDSAAMFIHFAIYHKVPGILLPKPVDVEQDPDWTPSIDPDARAKRFPFYCCPNCSYIDVEWNHIIQHMLKKHSKESSVFLGCVVRLIMVGRTVQHRLHSFTYSTLAMKEKSKTRHFRKDIYACVSCKFFSFYPTFAFCHYITSHSSIEMLYICAASPSCAKRCTSFDVLVSHIQTVHVAMKNLQFRCTATLLDTLTSTQLDVSPGELVSADVPVQVDNRPSSVSKGSSAESAIEIVDDDDDDDSDDVMILSPACEDKTSDDVDRSEDVKMESSLSVETTATPGNSELDPESATAEIVRGTADLSSSSQQHGSAATGDLLHQNNASSNDVSSTESEPVQNSAPQTSQEESVDCAATPTVSNSEMNQQTVRAADLADFSSSSQEHAVSEQAELTERYVVHNIEDETSVVNVDDNTCETVDLVSSSECQNTTEPLHEQNGNLGSHVTGETSDCALLSKDASPVADGSAATADLLHQNNGSSNDISEMNQQTGSAADVAVPTGDEINTGSSVYQADDLLEVEGLHACAVNKVANPQLHDVCPVQPQPFAAHQSNNDALYDADLGFDGNTFSSFELPSCPNDGESSVLELLLMSEEPRAGEPQPQDHCSKTDHAVSASSVLSSVDNANDGAVVDDSCIVMTESLSAAVCQDVSDKEAVCSEVTESEQLHASTDSCRQETAVDVDDFVPEHHGETSAQPQTDGSSELAAESTDSEMRERTDPANGQLNAGDGTVNQTRFKSLAGYRFSAPSSFLLD